MHILKMEPDKKHENYVLKIYSIYNVNYRFLVLAVYIRTQFIFTIFCFVFTKEKCCWCKHRIICETYDENVI